ncbi:MAG: hypothetical protein J6U70_01520 [Bacteroidales bacterium]|nr:hypothetical protein [Bacteroidales bacterium]
MEKQKHNPNDLGLANPELKKPYGTVPEGYWASLETAVHERIHPQAEGVEAPVSWWEQMKSHVFLALSFCVILGFGYGVMWLTGTAQQPDYAAETWDLSALVEDGFIRPASLDVYFDELFEGEQADFNQAALFQQIQEEDADDLVKQLNQMEILEYFYE